MSGEVEEDDDGRRLYDGVKFVVRRDLVRASAAFKSTPLRRGGAARKTGRLGGILSRGG